MLLLLLLQVRNAEAVSRVRRWLAEDGLTAAEAAERLVDHAMRLGADDNASVVLLRFSARPLTMQRVGAGAGVGRFGSAAGGGGSFFANSALRRARSEGTAALSAPSGAAVSPTGATALSSEADQCLSPPPLLLLPTLHEVSALTSSPPASHVHLLVQSSGP